MRILILMGGNSPERAVSLASGEAVAQGLDEKGHQVLRLDPAEPDKVYTMIDKAFDGSIGEVPVGENLPLEPEQIKVLMENIKKYSVDLVFPVLHGGWGEDGKLQALLEMINVPFVGSGSCASSIAMNKHLAKRIAVSVGVQTPEYFFLPREHFDKATALCKEFGFPLVVKPNSSGSSVALSIVKTAKNLERAIDLAGSIDDDILIERYIAGRELTVGVLDGSGLSVVEIKPKNGFYDYKHKYTSGSTEYVCPAELDLATTNACLEFAENTFNVFGCKVFGRVDFRLSEHGDLFFLEVNTIPGMTRKHGLLPKSAAAVGMSYEELVNRIVISSMNLKR